MFNRNRVTNAIFPSRSVSLSLVVSLATLFPAFSAFSSQESNLDVYPPNWWAGMQHTEVELMIFGKDVADDKVSVSEGRVQIKQSRALDSENYLFVTLDIADASPQELVLSLKDEDGSSRDIHYSLEKRAKGSSAREGFGPEDAIYLIAPDRFANGSLENDNVDGYQDKVDRTFKGGRHGGDIEGIANNLDYIKEMGFTQIWTMPMLENAMEKYSYHGYSTTDYYNIDPRFGSNETFVELSNKANENGIGVIMDMVLNHIGSEHVWMEDTPSSDWINNNGQFVGTTHKRESLHDPHAIASDIKGFSDGWFVPTMPDLNQRNPHLANYLIQNAIWWVETANLSGIRVDTYSYPDKGFLSQWTNRIMKEYPNFNIVGEEWSVNPAITAYWQAGSQRHDDYDSALPSVMDFPLQTAVVKALNSDESWNSGFITVYETLATDFLYGDPNNLVIFPDNHDMSRIFTQLNNDKAKWNMAMTLFLTTRGIPQVFYGTEILMGNEGTEDHGIIRSDFPGGWPSDSEKNAFSGKGLSGDELWAQERIKTLLALRQTHPQLFKGELKHYAPVDGVYTYFRVAEDTAQKLMVILNKKPVDLPLPKYAEVLGTDVSITRVSDGQTFNASETISLPAMSANVFIVQ
ncbi:glycoside hydrolase family 13 protein [Alteromonas sp. PRIM-21]|uniref:glycoside hydrolase family 13 protein n=1 Tax=Alteromonas sp. PRIM-21 TaxID=1454978 RepID=UPI0022B990A2|nr:glycoside hydrolase family 13 protein [Alteromonas sp. PRIM-21]MCZ8529350.1 glycoside hydrolase family 13 protein [Alteromonas sp. PRIM-21]